MQCLQLTRGEPPATTIAVTITGTGQSTRCYAIINGTKQYKAGTYEVNAGDTITFGVYGKSYSTYGFVKIDGTQVLKVKNGTTQTYDWTVPNGISTIKIAMEYSSNPSHGTITVTTDGELPATTVDVTIAGSGDARYCYATINGTKQYSAGTHEVNVGDTITFGVYGQGKSYGFVKIDGTEVLRVTKGSVQTYDWTVPSVFSTIEITMRYNGNKGSSSIIVTTS